MSNEDSRTLGDLYDNSSASHSPALPNVSGSSIGGAYQSWFEAAQEQEWLEAIEHRRTQANSDATQVISRADVERYRQAMEEDPSWDEEADNAVDVVGGRTLRQRASGSTPVTSTPVTEEVPPTPGTKGPTPQGQGQGQRGILRSSAIMAAGTLVSRVLGLLRSSLTVAAIGTTTGVANTWDVANTLPNIIYLLLAGGVINAVLVPQITRAMEHSDGGKAYTDRIVTLTLMILAAVTVVFMASAPLVYRLFDNNHMTADKSHLAWMFSLVCLPQIFFYGIYTIFGQILNARGHFGAFMWSPALANIVIVGGLIAFIAMYPHGDAHVADYGDWTVNMVLMLALPATLGIVAQALVLIPVLKRAGYSYSPNFQFRGVGLRSASTMAGWAFVAVIVQQIGLVITTQLLTSQPSGEPGKAAQSQAFLLFTLPHSLITLSLVTALFTRMSVAAGRGETQKVKDDITTGIRLSGIASIMLTFGCFALVFPLVGTMFNPGEGTVWAIGSIAIAMMIGLVPYSLCLVIQRVFYAYNDAKTPFWMQIICTGTAIALTVPWFFLQDTTMFGHPGSHWVGVGVGLAQTLSNTVQAVVGFIWLRRRIGSVALHEAVRTYVRLSVAAIAATLVALVILVAATSMLPSGRLASLTTLVLTGVPFLLIYLGVAKRLHVEEIDKLLAPVTRRLAR